LDKPFLTRNLWIYFIAFWMAVAVIQFVLSYGVYGQALINSITDSLISNIVFAVLGIGLWNMVRYSGKQVSGFLKNLAYHLASCALTILIWQFVSYSFLHLLFGNDDAFMNFLAEALVVKVLTGVLIYFLLISVDFLILSFDEMQEQAEHEATLSAMLRDAELNMLRSQIRPHFLFNSLNSVSSLTLSNQQAAQGKII